MPSLLTAGARQIDLSVPVCMGIINTTPDSFSDGSQLGKSVAGRFAVDLDKALFRAEQMHSEGAVLIDVGGESTRPGADPVSPEEELERVIPVIAAIARNLDLCISVDTSSARVMAEAIAAGAELVNDIRALTDADAMPLLRESKAAVCLMHMQGQPRTMQQSCHYDDVVSEVRLFLEEKAGACQAQGIGRERLLLDPGFGFGKSLQHNYQLLKGLPRLAELGLPLLVGVSRKSMIGGVVERAVDERVAGSVAATVLALQGGARIIRSHDVAASVDAIRIFRAWQQA